MSVGKDFSEIFGKKMVIMSADKGLAGAETEFGL